MGAPEVNKLQLYNEVNKFGINGDFARALKASNKLLNSFPNDEDAFHCKIVCLLNLGRFEDALQAFHKCPHLSKDLVFEKAHCLYRLNRNKEALDTLDSCPEQSLKIKELKAQIYYRIERFEECFSLYNDILKNCSDEYEEERHTNLAAIIANMASIGKVVEIPAFSFETYELAFNIATHYIFKNCFIEAEKKLRHAEKLCKESAEDGSIEEIEDDLTIIRLQLAYAIHQQGREKEAMGIYNSILQSKPTDPAVVAVLYNNCITVNRDQSLFDSKKKMKSCLTEAAQSKLTSLQNKQIAINNCLLNLRTGQSEQATELSKQLIQKYPGTECTSSMVEASILVKDGKTADAIAKLKKCAMKFGDNKLPLFLTIAQLLLREEKIDKACEVLEELCQQDYRPGIVSALASIYIEIGKSSKAADLLQRAVSWHQKNKGKSNNLSLLWRNAAELNLRIGMAEVAVKSLEEVLRGDPNNVLTLAQLVVSYSKFNVKEAKYYSEKLSELIDITPGIDVSTLEASNWMMGLKAIKKANKLDPLPSTPRSEGRTKTKASKKNKKKKLPANCERIEGFVPDPERWLPKYERSMYRKKKDRRGAKDKDVGKGTQGTAASVADQFDITKIASQKQSSSPSSADMKQAAQRNKSAVHHKKKKKSGKK